MTPGAAARATHPGRVWRHRILGVLACASLAGCAEEAAEAPDAPIQPSTPAGAPAPAPPTVVPPAPGQASASDSVPQAPPASEPAAPQAGSPASAAPGRLVFRLQELPTPQDLRTRKGEIVIVGTINTPTTCQRVTGDLGRSGDTIRVEVRAQSDGGSGCGTAAGQFGYEASVRGLSPGRYPVVVRHLPEPRSEAVEVLSRVVEVP